MKAKSETGDHQVKGASAVNRLQLIDLLAICAVKQAIASDLDTQYQDPDVCIYADEHVYTNGPTSEMSGSPDRRTRSNCQQLSG